MSPSAKTAAGGQGAEALPDSDLERRILHGLGLEWEQAAGQLDAPLRELMRKPLFSLGDLGRHLGQWLESRMEIRINRRFAFEHPWDSVCAVLRHEMAHQLAGSFRTDPNEPPHGPKFQRACFHLRADPRASGDFPTLRESVFSEGAGERDPVIRRVRKLLALAGSSNAAEAEAAAAKAHELILKHNLERIGSRRPPDFVSLYLGQPALRHTRDKYALSALLQNFYFVEGIWISAFALKSGKMGRVLEVSGTPQNIRMADYVYHFILHYIDAQWRIYNKNRSLGARRKTDFATGVIIGFQNRLKSQREEMAAASPDERARALIRVGDPALTQYVRRRYPRLRSFRRGGGRDIDVFNYGYGRGRDLVINKGIEEKGDGTGGLLE